MPQKSAIFCVPKFLSDTQYYKIHVQTNLFKTLSIKTWLRIQGLKIDPKEVSIIQKNGYFSQQSTYFLFGYNYLYLLPSYWPKVCRVLAILTAIRLTNMSSAFDPNNNAVKRLWCINILSSIHSVGEHIMILDFS